MRRREILALTLLLFIALSIPQVKATYYGPDVLYQSHLSGGYLVFKKGFNASGITWVYDLIRFHNFNMSNNYVGDLGFEIPPGVNITVYDVNSSAILMGFNYTSMCTPRVYTPGLGRPETVSDFVWGWEFSSKTTGIMVTEGINITMSWEGQPSIYYEDDYYSQPSTSLRDLISVYLDVGDVSGFTIALYTESMGVMFFALVLFIISVPIYRKLGLFPTSVIWTLFWASWNTLLPPRGVNLAVAILTLSIGVMLTILFVARRGSQSA